ncbi:unnamed protein product [Sphagnum tenellum]
MSAKHRIIADAFTPLRDNVFVTDLEYGPRLSRGIIIPDDNMTDRGVRDRWARVWAIGPEVTDLAVGEWVLIKHGRWTIGMDMNLGGVTTEVWRIEYPDAVMLVSDTDPPILRERIYNFINRTGNAGVTDEEICLSFGLTGDIERPRRNELVRSNLVANSGVRRATTSGRTATVWKSVRVLDKVAETAAKTAKRSNCR